MRLKSTLILLFGVVTIYCAVLVTQPGHFSVDEIAYHVMVRSLAETGSLSFLNGYQDFPSAEFVLPVTVVHAGRLVSQYPALYSFLAAPFYSLMGYGGLFLLSSIAFCCSVWLCYLTAQRIFRDKNLSLNACLVFTFASYAWDYAQAAWPHALTGLVVIASTYFMLRSTQCAENKQSIAWAIAAGFITGLGVGVRVDAVFVLPALIFLPLFANPVRLQLVAAVLLGTAPGLVAMAAINNAKFGIASPFSYGKVAATWSAGSLMGYMPLVATAAAVTAVLWPLSRPAGRAFVAAHRWPVAIIVTIAAGSLLGIPDVRALVSRSAIGFYQLVIDLRVRDLGIIEGGLSRGPGGSMIYIGGLKKSLLQSCPYLAALTIPIWALARGRQHALPLAMLLLVPIAFIGVYAFFAWHGGMSLNLRYFVPILPFTAILTAYAWRDLMLRAGANRIGVRTGGFLAIALAFAWVAIRSLVEHSVKIEELLLLTLPLVLAITLFALTISHLLAARATGGAIAQAALCGLIVSFVWSALVVFSYDWPLAQRKRAFDVLNYRRFVSMIAPGSLVVTEQVSRFAGLYSGGDIRIAATNLDDFASFRPLVQSYFRSGKPVYGWFSKATWQRMRSRGLLASVKVKPLHSRTSGTFAQLVPASSDAADCRTMRNMSK